MDKILKDYLIITKDANESTGSINQEEEQEARSFHLMLKLQDYFHLKSKGASMPELPTETKPISRQPECETTETKETKTAENTASANGARTASGYESIKTNASSGNSQPSKPISKPHIGWRFSFETVKKCPFCRREIITIDSRPCCGLWAAAYSYKRRSNPTAKVSDTIR